MSGGNDEIVTALYDYYANDSEELSIRKNEQLVLLDDRSAWWKVRNGNGNLGMVPSNYLRRDKGKGESLVNRIANKIPGTKNWKLGGGGGSGTNSSSAAGRSGSESMYPHPSTGSSANHFANSAAVNEEYVSKFNYDATKADELTLCKGMRVLVITMENDGWWFGRDADQPSSNPGWFPSNYVVKEEHPSPASNSSSHIPPSFAEPPKSDCIMVVRTLYPFNSGNEEELAFEQDETLDIIEEPSNDPEWYLARNKNGVTGLVPKNYVEEAPKESSNPSVENRSNGISAASFNDHLASPQQDENPFSGKDWFFGPMKRSEAEQILNERAKNGEFLVRNAETAPNDFSISMRMPGRMRHFKIKVLPNGGYEIGQKQFESLDALIDHYKRSPIYTSKEEGKACLTNPVPR